MRLTRATIPSSHLAIFPIQLSTSPCIHRRIHQVDRIMSLITTKLTLSTKPSDYRLPTTDYQKRYTPGLLQNRTFVRYNVYITHNILCKSNPHNPLPTKCCGKPY